MHPLVRHRSSSAENNAKTGPGPSDTRVGPSRTGLLTAGLMMAIAAFLWFAMLGNRALYEPDEGRYAEIPREMLADGNWIIPRLNGIVYLEKPPLQYWLTALGYRAFGESEGVARLCTGIAGFLSLLTVFLLARRLWGAQAGVNAASLTAASTLFVLLGHQLTLDMLLTCCLTAALGCFLMAQEWRADDGRSRQWMLGCWGMMSAAVLTKGLVGVVIPSVTVALYAVWQRDRDVLRSLNIRWGLPLFLLLTCPWFIAAARANPDFLRYFFVREHFQRFLTPIEHRTEPWWFFIAVLSVGILPWLPQAVRAAASSWRTAAPRGRFDAGRVLLVWSGFILVFFSISDSKLVTYVLPAVPALALLCVCRATATHRGSLAMGIGLSLAAGAGMLIYVDSSWGTAQGRELALALRTDLLWNAGLLAVAGLMCIALLARRRELTCLAVLSGAWFLTSCNLLAGADHVQEIFSGRTAALQLRAVAPVGTPIYSVRTYDQALPFYLKRPVVLVDFRDEFGLGLDQEPERGIASLEEFSRRWRASADGFAVMRPATYALLLAEGLPMREFFHVRHRIIVSRR